MDQFVDGKHDRFEIGCLCAAGECIAMHRNTSILWSLFMQMKVVEGIIKNNSQTIFKSEIF